MFFLPRRVLVHGRFVPPLLRPNNPDGHPRRVAVVIPYRDRAEHLKRLLPALRALGGAGTSAINESAAAGAHFQIVVAEQADRGPAPWAEWIERMPGGTRETTVCNV